MVPVTSKNHYVMPGEAQSYSTLYLQRQSKAFGLHIIRPISDCKHNLESNYIMESSEWEERPFAACVFN